MDYIKRDKIAGLTYILMMIGGAIFWFVVAMAIFSRCHAQEYKSSARMDILSSTAGYQFKGLGSIKGDHYNFGKDKWAAMLVVCGAGFVDGMVEGYEFDGRKSFERKWGVDSYGFFGSQSWDSEWTAWERAKMSQTDFYHVADDVRKWGYQAGGFMLGRAAARHNKRRVHDWFDVLLVGVASGLWKSAGMYYVRHIDW